MARRTTFLNCQGRRQGGAAGAAARGPGPSPGLLSDKENEKGAKKGKDTEWQKARNEKRQKNDMDIVRGRGVLRTSKNGP